VDRALSSGLLDAANSNGQRIFYSMAGGDRKKLRSRGGFEVDSALSHMNRQNMNTPVKNQIQTKP
jgi:hypothetical protein